MRTAVTSSELAFATFNAMTASDSSKVVYDIVGQKNHGVCAIGANPWDAYEHIERLEHICEIVLKSGVQPHEKKFKCQYRKKL